MRLLKLALAGAAFLGSSLVAQAQDDFPSKPIEFVCATSAGSGAANWCLLMAEMAGEQLGTPIEVLFKPSGAGNEAAAYVASKPADGHTWLHRNTSYGGYMNLPTFQPDPMGFEVPVEVEKFLYVIAVNKDAPYQTWEDLVTAMKAADEPIPVAANKPGSAHHLHIVKLFEAAGVPFRFVPYNGSGGAMRDTLAGAVDVAIGPPGIWIPHVQEGNARFLMLINEEHIDRPGLAGLPIPSDFGMEYDMTHQVQGMFTKKGTPPEVNAKIAAALEAATSSDRYKEYAAQQVHVVPQFSGDIDANTERFHGLLGSMKAALTEAGIIN